MQEINEILKKYDLHPRKYTKNNKAILIETSRGKYRIKPKSKNKEKIYEYLKSRNFDYLPKIITPTDEDYEVIEYIESYNIPEEQRIIDLIDLISLLHNKTTHYQETTEDDYKEIYEDLNNNIEYLYSYYNDLITLIENKVYMSPCEYLIARNISIIFKTLDFIHEETKEWYELVKDKQKKRLVVLHNNLELSHFISNKKNYLISWDKSKIGIPIFDLYKLYLNHGLDFDFTELFKRYEKNYPLHKDERKLLFILILMPQKLEFGNSEYENTRSTSKKIDLIYKTHKLISPYYSNKRPEHDSHKQKN